MKRLFPLVVLFFISCDKSTPQLNPVPPDKQEINNKKNVCGHKELTRSEEGDEPHDVCIGVGDNRTDRLKHVCIEI